MAIRQLTDLGTIRAVYAEVEPAHTLEIEGNVIL